MSSDERFRTTIPPPVVSNGILSIDKPLAAHTNNPIVIITGDQNMQGKRELAWQAVSLAPQRFRFIPSLTNRGPRLDDRPDEFEYVTPDKLLELGLREKLAEWQLRGDIVYARAYSTITTVAREHVGIAVMSLDGVREIRRRRIIPCVVIFVHSVRTPRSEPQPIPEDIRFRLTIGLEDNAVSLAAAATQVRQACCDILWGVHPGSGPPPGRASSRPPR